MLVTWDEGGGFFDHVAPPADSAVDNQPYGTRVPLLAIGRYARRGRSRTCTMEHSSIVKFLEWNYLGGQTGQLGARDAGGQQHRQPARPRGDRGHGPRPVAPPNPRHGPHGTAAASLRCAACPAARRDP